MKKTYAFALSILLAAAAVAFSTTLAATRNASASTVQDSAMKAQHAKVVTVDAAKNEISVKDSKGGEIALRVSSTTKITKGGKEITLAEIKAGDMVAYELEGTGENATVKTLTVTPAKASS